MRINFLIKFSIDQEIMVSGRFIGLKINLGRA